MRNAAERHHHLWCFLVTFTLFPLLTASIDLITPTKPLAQNNTLVSAAAEFELGFFPGTPNTWYVGIWYKNIPERVVVWVANRDSTLTNSSGILKISPLDARLTLQDHSGTSLWSSPNHSATGGSRVAELLDNGNFVLREEDDDDPDNYLWQSFDYPTDTLLPGMKLGWDSKTGLNRFITSWKSADDPSTGDYSFKLDIYGYPEIHLANKEKIYYRSGPWNGLRFSGVPEMKPTSQLLSFVFVRNSHQVSYSFNLLNESMYSRLVVKHSGALQRLIWIPSSRIWNPFWYAPKDQCDVYRECGVYGICDANASPVCKCMKAFEPKDPQAWSLRDGSDGCVRVVELDCGTDGFLAMSSVKLPESGAAYVYAEMSLDQCRDMCRRNCSCRGYSSANISDGSGCVVWAEDLYDMRQYAASEGGGQDFYYRVPAAELAPAASGAGDDSNKTRQTIMIAGIVIGSAAMLLGLAIFLASKKRKSETVNIVERRGSRERSQDYLLNAPTIPSKRDQSGETAVDDIELPLFDITTLSIATNKFSDEKKLGQGGFGIVYKGVLAEGQEIAVKRLSKTSVQGVDEFKNEMKLIARLQHRNLVRLLGCCVEMEEKMLVYEYMENKSLDSILFKKNKSSMLDWQTRFKIISGIARGLLYLHQDSRFRIIHRDLKASNILLDKDMEPKISDFGMARIFGGDQTEANTKKVVGTYGYMSPEYAMDGLFSIKSDVFSFGVLVLEIVSGMKNRGFYQTNNHLNLLAYAWKLYREGRALELVDSAAGEEYVAGEVLRCIQVGLLCVQEQAEDRPNMSNVVLMLSSDFVSMQQPKHPGYCLGRRPTETDPSLLRMDDESCTVNQSAVRVAQHLTTFLLNTCLVIFIHSFDDIIYNFKVEKFPFTSTHRGRRRRRHFPANCKAERMKLDTTTLFHTVSFLVLLFKSSIAIDSIAPNQTLLDNNNNNTSLVSPNGNFVLGFFSPQNSTNRYIGIWFNKVSIQTVVWVANKNRPISDSSGALSVTPAGNIVITSNQSSIIWSANSTSSNPVLRLLDNGNLVLDHEGSSGSYLWQSFDYPCDTLIPGMRLGWDLRRNQELYLTSRKSMDNPSPGEYTYRMNPKGLPSIILRRGSTIVFRSGPWDGVRFGGSPALHGNSVFTPIFVFNSTYVYYEFENTDDSVISRLVVSESGALAHFRWSEASNDWISIAPLIGDLCDEYDKCGSFGVCEFGRAPLCDCLAGFVPRVGEEWARFDWAGGCSRRAPLNCSTAAGFRRFSRVKVPDTSASFVDANARNEKECEAACLRDCSCVAYARTEATGCVVWSGELLDIRVYEDVGQELFVKMPLSELGSRKSKRIAVIVSVMAAAFVVVLTLVIWLVIRKRVAKKKAAQQQHDFPIQSENACISDEDVALPMIDFLTISTATNEFSFSSKIGEGGFGPVYKGVLSNGKEIAVKRLSQDSGQGLHEFKNEVILIAKLQHRNLVRLLGCCIHQNERMLVYEYMPNKSLDFFIFDQTKDTSLEWRTRYDIIVGIARGLVYLHRDSRLRIIHRDLKASNILLDNEMNPKISDFGLARMLGADQYQEKTKRVMGTYGYMAPEYAVDGFFSVKSDVFSFGVLVLEIISGKKNRGFYHPDHDLNLLGHAWKLWTEGNPKDFVDASILNRESLAVVRCIQVGLLCAQQRPEDRPTMSNVVVMLDGEYPILDQPKQPGFYTQRTMIDTDSSSTGKMPNTSNEITVTLLHGR
ncbi:hypothetical protein SASPL_121333 [Salvia splendens]|uniref:non-specific serine/threonine protein kinase n=1 Tax=Salvia splendens TaxID=180675 RepID=A0A8X8XUR5_SALSN|nr:hypothetical protein SASPL_121333 [Salvia splendens]